MIEPPMGYRVFKDLVVDMEPFFEQYRRVRPYLTPDELPNDREGVWRCRTIHNCTRACPRDIRVTKAIAEVKQAILRGRV